MNTFEELNAEFNRQLVELQKDYKNAAYIRVSCEQLAVMKDEPNAVDKFGSFASAAEPDWNGFLIVRRGTLLDGKLRDSKPRLPCIDLTKVER